MACGLGQQQDNLECNCNTVSNSFPLTIAGEGDLTESLSCSGDSPVNFCTITGNITWTPSASCCALSGNWSNSNMNSGSTDSSCSGAFQQFSNCSGPTSNPHPCQLQCVPVPGTPFSGWAVVLDCSGGSLGTALKQFRCIS